MKISSASKKVLASALSAAMVVAFAPTVAFGAQSVTVNIDLDGGSGAQTAYNGFEAGDTITLGNPTKNGYELSHWWYDANGDGVDDSGEDITDNTFKLPGDKAEVTLKAVYKAPSTGISYANAKLTIANSSADVVAQHTYTLTVTGPTGQLAKHTFAPADNKADTKANILDTVTVDFVSNPLTNANKDADNADSADYGKWTVNADSLVSGAYTATLTDGDAVISTEKVELCTVTTVDGKNDPVKTIVAKKGKFTLDSGKNWVDEDGYSVSGEQTIKGDVTYKTTKVAQVAKAGTYKQNTRSIEFKLEDTAAQSGDKYAVSVKDPSGAEIYTAEYTAAGSFAKDVEFSFDKNSDMTRVSASEAAGDYVMTVTKTPADVAADVTTSKAKATLTQVTYDAGEGSIDSSVKDSEKSYFVDSATTTVTALDSSKVKAPEGKKFKAWTLDGKALDKLSAGKVNTITATYEADANRIDTPTATVAKVTENKVDYYVITVSDAVNGAKITYKADGGSEQTYTAPIKVAVNSAASKYEFTASYASGTTDKAYKDYEASKTLTLTKNEAATEWASYTADSAQKNFEALIGQTKDKWLSNEGIAAAIAAGKTAIEAEGIYTSDAKATAKVEVAAYKALYDAVNAASAAELGKYADAAPVVVGDKAYYIETATLADVNKDIADNVTKTVTNSEARAEAAKTPVATNVYTTAINNLVSKTNTALKAAKKSDLSAADITAAQTVTAALQAAKTADEAKAALEAYNKLTDAQKKLVAATDVAAAQKVVSDAEAAKALADAQDEAAIAAVKGKTVKAKAKKKTTSSLKVVTSKSGAVSTFAKKSGNAKITVSKAGKITVKKGLKAGKTYKAKVKATVGAQTKTVTVTVKVAK